MCVSSLSRRAGVCFATRESGARCVGSRWEEEWGAERPATFLAFAGRASCRTNTNNAQRNKLSNKKAWSVLDSHPSSNSLELMGRVCRCKECRRALPPRQKSMHATPSHTPFCLERLIVVSLSLSGCACPRTQSLTLIQQSPPARRRRRRPTRPTRKDARDHPVLEVLK